MPLFHANRQVDIAVYDKGLNRLETELFAESINELDFNSSSEVSIICDACDVDEQGLAEGFLN